MLFCIVLDITQTVNLQKNQMLTMTKNGPSKIKHKNSEIYSYQGSEHKDCFLLGC